MPAPGELVPVELKVGTFPFPRRMEPERVQALRRTALPLPCARTPIPQGPLGAIIERVLSPFRPGLDGPPDQAPQGHLLLEGEPGLPLLPERSAVDAEEDELHPGRRALRLSFELPKGSYATILVKRITDAAEAAP